MSVDFGAYLGQTVAINEQSRAVDAWRRINRRPARGDDSELGIAFTKPKVVTKTSTTPEAVLPRQIVRIESDNRPSVVKGVAGAAPQRHAIVYGVRDHPSEDVADTDMEEGYIFTLEGDNYRCIDVILVPGEKQGVFIVNG